ncbi:MAG: tRNA-intron lyase [Candidatus Methanomethylicota archaeon]|nr:tRNA-intron lyase [Candidatus Culexmicrobium cathedralense]RLE48839.1 MAG: tRNA-intron lyase [Candidatus Verstraetearchaeota archaeon]
MSDNEIAVAVLMNGRVVVWDVEASRRLYREGFYGKPVGIRKPKDMLFDAPLELSLFEALYLLEKGRIRVVDVQGAELTRDELLKIARETYSLFDDIYRVYRDLRERGFVVRPGMKFGADFAVYEFGPGIDHAPFLVDVLPMNSKLDPIEIVRAGRLSHSVRKRFIIAVTNPETKEVSYFMFKWFKA